MHVVVYIMARYGGTIKTRSLDEALNIQDIGLAVKEVLRMYLHYV